MSAAYGNGVVDPLSAANGASPPPAAGDPDTQRRPEVAVGAAFAGGFLFALLLRRIRS